jgi:hypothetical protein
MSCKTGGEQGQKLKLKHKLNGQKKQTNKREGKKKRGFPTPQKRTKTRPHAVLPWAWLSAVMPALLPQKREKKENGGGDVSQR